MKVFTTKPGYEIAAVEVPEGTFICDLDHDHLLGLVLDYYDHDGGDFIQLDDAYDYTFLALASEVTEGQAREMMPKCFYRNIYDDPMEYRYKNFVSERPDSLFYTASPSWQSFCTANGIKPNTAILKIENK